MLNVVIVSVFRYMNKIINIFIWYRNWVNLLLNDVVYLFNIDSGNFLKIEKGICKFSVIVIFLYYIFFDVFLIKLFF